MMLSCCVRKSEVFGLGRTRKDEIFSVAGLLPHSENFQDGLCTVICLLVVSLLRFAFFDRAQTPGYIIQYICLEE
jgi:hypothetical protein